MSRVRPWRYDARVRGDAPGFRAIPVDRDTLIRWLRIRTKVENVKLFVEP